ncbi:MAG: N-acetylmuramoyl-L-alanine amidase [Lachnospiraceae bacterium]|nr:N-acetylmuramoyl-L-alanine amidase [Lachnospiraceae bacterium]
MITNSEQATTAESRTDENGNWVPPYPTDIKIPSWITVDLIDVNEKIRPGRLLTSVDNIVVHYVGNPNTTAKSNRDFFNDIPTHDNEKGASAHFVVGLDGEVIQCVPLGEVAFANYPRNDFTISIETCHPDDTGKFTETTYWSLIRLISWLCEEYGLTSEQVIRHYDVSGKYCPCYYCPNNQDNPYGHPDAWDQLKADVAYYIKRFPNIGEIDP